MFFDKSRTELSKFCLQNEESFKIQHKELLSRGVRSSTKCSHERLHIGDIVQLLLDRGFEKKFPSRSISSNGSPTFFVVGGFLESSTEMNSAIVKISNVLSPSALGQLPHSHRPHKI